ncbi:putative calcium-binding protein CML25 [Acorus gramineus]|uniref:Calcium-binding protein CML25 n=1 Tax=Acorus gramineus TaxID=55184 RepID=A0AAV9A1K5_ACOGR|nr:putative calcium-binding protein CML25 [Acorus gramineus]
MADSDGDGFIDLGEFMELNTRDVDDAAALEDLREAFAVFDVNGDASISAEELFMVFEEGHRNPNESDQRKMEEKTWYRRLKGVDEAPEMKVASAGHDERPQEHI